MSSSRFVMTSLAALLLAGCNTAYRDIGSPDPGFGETVKWNAAVHVIDPDPVYAEHGAQPGDSGVKGAEAVERYRTDRVKDVRVLTTTSGSGGGSGGSGATGTQ